MVNTGLQRRFHIFDKHFKTFQTIPISDYSYTSLSRLSKDSKILVI